MVMGHIVLLGDSIFDNARYVPDRPPVIEQVRRGLPQGWQASLLAVDGHTSEDIANQLADLPSGATHLFVSAGGNDALGESGILNEAACTVGEALALVHDLRMRFRHSYRAMLRALSGAAKPTAVCTVYDSIPDLSPADQAALATFNELILREAFQAGIPVIDLRLVCDRPSDYSQVSSIEPSMVGGAKIARVIVEVATTHDFSQHRSVIYS
jgi:hypothetical protein